MIASKIARGDEVQKNASKESPQNVPLSSFMSLTVEEEGRATGLLRTTSNRDGDNSITPIQNIRTRISWMVDGVEVTPMKCWILS